MMGASAKDPLKKLPFTIPELVAASPSKSAEEQQSVLLNKTNLSFDQAALHNILKNQATLMIVMLTCRLI